MQICPELKKIAPAARGRHLLDIDIGHHDDRRLAAKLERDALQRVGGAAVDDLADLRGPGEGDLVDVGMPYQEGAGRVAIAGDDVDDTRRESGFRHEIGEAQCGQRGLFSRLEDHGATGRERRGNLVHRHQQREIPRDDLRCHADRLTRHVAEHLAAWHSLRFNQLAVQLRCPARHVAQHVDRIGNVDHGRHAHRLAVVDRFEFGEFRGVRLDQVREPVEDALALVGRKIRPAAVIESGPRRGDGTVHVGAGRVHDARDLQTRRWIFHRQRCAVRGSHPFIVDEQRRRACQRALGRRRIIGLGEGSSLSDGRLCCSHGRSLLRYV